MKKRILAVVLALSMVFSFLPFGVFAADTDTTITFEFGANGSASHADGSSKTSYSETVSGYTLNLTASSQFYTGARDAKGNSAIKLGSSSNVGGFKFTVPDDVTSVIIQAAKYKTNASKLSVNGTTYTLSGASANGQYDTITVDTSTDKAVTVTTVSGGVRAMINSISYVISASEGGEPECEHNYTSEVTTAPTCTNAGVETFTCSLCGDSYEQKLEATGHTNVGGVCSVCGTDLSSIVFELGADGTTAKENSTASTSYTETKNGYTLKLTGASRMYLNCIDANGNGVIKFGSSSAAGSCTIVVDDDVSKIIISVAGRNNAKANIIVNGVAQTINSTSDSGVYEDVEVDTSTNKTVTFSTASGGWRAFVNSITYVFAKDDGSEPECEHNYTSEVTTAPTCTAPGVRTYTCSLCGASYTEAVAATGHTMEAGEVVPPTVDGQGYTIYTCACGETEKRDFTNPLAPEIPEGTEPIIFEFGENGDAVHDDGDSAKATYEQTNGDYKFSFTDGVRIYPNAFDAKGNSALKLGTGSAVASFSFTVPEKVSQVWIRVAGYKDNNSSFTVNETDYTIQTHSNDGIYTYIVVDTSSEKTVNVSTRSANDGYRAMIDSITYLASTACEHSYESVTVDPTCTKAGKTVHTCSKCGDSYEETIAALDHDYKSVVTDPTCTEDGYTTYTCERCGDTYKDNEVAALDHDYKSVVTDPTCTEDGYTTYTCERCGDTYKDNEVAASHNYKSVVTDPTCTEDGYTTYTCERCGDTYKDNEVAASGHNYDSVVVAPTITDTGYTKHTCSGCGDTSVSDPVSSKSGKVHNVAVTSDGETVTVTWDALTAVDKYIAYIYAMDGTLVKCAQKVTNKVAFAGIEPGDYVVLVIAKTTNGWYDFLLADEVGFTVTEKQPEPGAQSPSASAGEITPDYVTITWPAVDGASKYAVKITGNGETVYRSATTNSIKVYGLKPATEYEISVNAKTASGYLGYGDVSTITTAAANNAIPSTQALASDSVTLVWDAINGADKYFVKFDSENGTRYYQVTSNSITINGLEPEKTYTVSINTRTNGNNYSGYGSSYTFTTPSLEGIVINSQLKADGVHLSWTSGLPFDKVWVKEVLADGTQLQHVALSNGADKYTVNVYEEGTREFFLIVRVQTSTGNKYVTTDSIFVTLPALNEVQVSNEDELRSALAAAQAGEIVKITLTEDITTTIADDANAIFTVPKAADVVLNLNGKKITAIFPDNEVSKAEAVFYLSQDSTLAVEGNGSIDATMGTNSSNLTTIFNNCGATLLIIDGSYNLTLEEGKKAFIADIVDSNSTLGETKTTILDGYFTTSDNIGNMFRNYANHRTESCSLIIEGGKFVSEYTSASYPKAVFWNQAANANAKGTGYVNIVRGSFSGLEVENEHPAENVTIGKKAFIGVYGTATYVESTEELKDALANGGYIVLNGDIDLSAAEITGNVITENTVLDLNGHTISYAAEYVSGMNGTQISAITVDNAATLVIGNGTVDANSAYGIYVKDGNLVVESGSYSAVTSAIQVYNGTATINGGSFAGSATYLLNCIDSAYNNGDAEIVVKGGEFAGFNPADNAAETGGHINFVADGYKVIEKNGAYIVVSEDYE